MDGDLVNQCQNLRINEAESKIIDIGVVGGEEDVEHVSLLLLGKLVTVRRFNVEAFKRTMTLVWSVSNRLVIRMVGAHLFVFQFFHWRDKEKVLDGRPWSFDNQLLVLNEISGNEQPSKVILTHSPFWVRIKDLPFNCRSNSICKAIASTLGTVLEIENNDFNLDSYRRVRVNLDITKPLCRSQKIKCRDGRVIMISFAYERLPFFCYLCGIIGHSNKDCCNISEEDENKVMGWSKSLQASPRRGVRKFNEEVEEVKASRKILFVSKPTVSEPNLEQERDKEHHISTMAALRDDNNALPAHSELFSYNVLPNPFLEMVNNYKGEHFGNSIEGNQEVESGEEICFPGISSPTQPHDGIGPMGHPSGGRKWSNDSC